MKRTIVAASLIATVVGLCVGYLAGRGSRVEQVATSWVDVDRLNPIVTPCSPRTVPTAKLWRVQSGHAECLDEMHGVLGTTTDFVIPAGQSSDAARLHATLYLLTEFLANNTVRYSLNMKGDLLPSSARGHSSTSYPVTTVSHTYRGPASDSVQSITEGNAHLVYAQSDSSFAASLETPLSYFTDLSRRHGGTFVLVTVEKNAPR
jgi:hypothetical protein